MSSCSISLFTEQRGIKGRQLDEVKCIRLGAQNIILYLYWFIVVSQPLIGSCWICLVLCINSCWRLNVFLPCNKKDNATARLRDLTLAVGVHFSLMTVSVSPDRCCVLHIKPAPGSQVSLSTVWGPISFTLSGWEKVTVCQSRTRRRASNTTDGQDWFHCVCETGNH